ncbi:MAG: hypothetical protein V7K89_31930 [Nostoc sp.]
MNQISKMNLVMGLRNAIAVGKIPILGKFTRDFVQPLDNAVQSKVQTLFQMNSLELPNLRDFRLF